MEIAGQSDKLLAGRMGNEVTVSRTPKAKLMFYLNCVCNLLTLDGDSELQRLRAYPHCRSLTREETDKLVAYCMMLAPNVLVGKCIFQDDALCGSFKNQFYPVEAVNNSVVVAESIVIGGQRRAVQNTMAFKASWLRDNYLEPMEFFIKQKQSAQRPVHMKTFHSAPPEEIMTFDNSHVEVCYCWHFVLGLICWPWVLVWMILCWFNNW